MKNNKFGFKALEHRANILKLRNIFKLEDDRKLDLSKTLMEIHGNQYVQHPRLENLLKLNQIVSRDFLSGPIEASLINQKRINKVSQSTLSKVEAFEEIIRLEFHNKLKVDKKENKINIGFFQSKFDKVKDKWYYELFISPIWNHLFSIILPVIMNYI